MAGMVWLQSCHERGIVACRVWGAASEGMGGALLMMAIWPLDLGTKAWYDHTMVKAPGPIRSPKLSTIRLD